MSTNYYTTITRTHCSTCDRPGDWEERFHIGKSAGGWRFNFRAYEEPKLTSLKEWVSFLEGRKIYDEYGREISLEGFLHLVKVCQDGRGHSAHYPDAKNFTDAEGYEFSWREFS